MATPADDGPQPPPEPDAPAPRRPSGIPRRPSAKAWGALGTAVAGLVMVLLTGAVQDAYAWAKLRFAEPYTVAVEHDRDRILDDGVGHEYVTTSPVGKIPAPPVAGPASCAGRYRWGRQPVIGGVDAGSSAAEVSLTAGPDLVSVEGARVVHDRPPAAPVAGAWLRCPPAGGPREIRQLEVDLDADQVAFVEAEGEVDAEVRRSRLAVDVEPGRTEAIRISARTERCSCTWRLELFLRIDGKRRTVTVGADGARPGTAAENRGQRPFRTSATTKAASYYFAEGRWQEDANADANRGPTPQLPSPPPGTTACDLLSRGELKPFFPVGSGDPLAAPTGATSVAGGRLRRADRCLWTFDEDQVDLEVRQLATPAEAERELAAKLRQLRQAQQEFAVAGVGETATLTGNTIVARRGAFVLTLSIQPHTSAGLLEVLAGRAVARIR